MLRALGEVFRAHGYEGASLTLITEATGLGKGSLYHLFPGGKEQMAAEVLADIDGWFELNIYAPLREASDPARAIAAMIAGVDQYFHSGDRVCLVGLVALGSARDTFAEAVDDYFARWQVALAQLLRRSGLSKEPGAAARGRCAADHSGRAGAGAGAQRRRDISPGVERSDGAVAGAVEPGWSEAQSADDTCTFGRWFPDCAALHPG